MQPYREKYSYGRYVKYVPPKPEECILGDCAFLYAKDSDVSKYHLIKGTWETLAAWAENIVKEHEAEPESAQVQIGKEIVKWSRQEDAFALYILLRMHWPAFQESFLRPETPRIVLDMIDAIMAGKLTEEERKVLL